MCNFTDQKSGSIGHFEKGVTGRNGKWLLFRVRGEDISKLRLHVADFHFAEKSKGRKWSLSRSLMQAHRSLIGLDIKDIMVVLGGYE